MTKKEKYINDLKKNLEDFEYVDEIVSKYEFIIDEKVKFGNKITSVLSELGPANEVADKEIEKFLKKNYFKKSINNILEKIKSGYKKIFQKTSDFFMKLKKKRKRIEFKKSLI